MFKLLRFFSITSLISIAVTAALLMLFYRYLMIEETVQVSERGNQDLAQSLLSSVRPDIDAYLASVENAASGQAAPAALSSRALDLFKSLLRETSVVRIKLYDGRGVVVFSTDALQIGDNQSTNAGLVTARSGGVASGLAYHGAVNEFDGEKEEQDLLQTYIPVQNGPSGPVRGVFEVYTQANPLLSGNERTVFAALVGVALILLCHYASLILAARRARNVIDAQQRTIRERTATLEKLSAEMMSSAETDKHKLAVGLHEGLAQTLSAIKVCVEQSIEAATSSSADGTLQPSIAALQDAIRDVRTIAMGLRPSSLDDLGLVPTVLWSCREFEYRHPDIALERELSLKEEDVPPPLRIVIYRTIESALKIFAARPDTERLRLGLGFENGSVVLTIESLHDASPDLPARHSGRDEGDSPFAALQERTTLSGGTFTLTSQSGITRLRATWNSP